MSEGKEVHKQLEEDVKEDLELKDEDAEKVGGADKDAASLYNLSATGKHIPEVTIR